MRYHEIRTIEDAYIYMVDCQLATVVRMATLKSRSEGDYKRQISIAQIGVDNIIIFKLNQNDSRIKEVFDLGGSVQVYADNYDVKRKAGK